MTAIAPEVLQLRPDTPFAASPPDPVAIAGQISVKDSRALVEMSRQIGAMTARYADDIIRQARSSDFDEAGKKLAEILALARSSNAGQFSERSSVPVIGPLIDKIRLRKDLLLDRFDNTRGQIDALSAEVDVTQAGLGNAVTSLDAMYADVRQQYELLGVYIKGAEIAHERDKEVVHEAEQSACASPDRALVANEMVHGLGRLEMHIDNLKALQHATLQMLPQIRLIQSNAERQREKFDELKTLTVPSWKRSFALMLLAQQTKKAAELSNDIADANNAFLRHNADLVYETTVATARLSNRMIIDVKTLEHVQSQLVKTLEDASRFVEEGRKERRQAIQQIEHQRQQFGQWIAAGKSPSLLEPAERPPRIQKAA